MSVFKRKGGEIYYAGFSVGGRYYVRSTGTANRKKALHVEKQLRSKAAAGKLESPSPEERARSITRSLKVPKVRHRHDAKIRKAVDRREADPDAKAEWINSIKKGQSVPEVKAKMIDANRATAKNPVSKKRKHRSLKKMWKRPGHTSRVSASLKKTLATDESKKRRSDGRLRWAKEILEQNGVPFPGSAHGEQSRKPHARKERRLKPKDLAQPFRVGSIVEQKIARGQGKIDARREVADEEDLDYDTVKKYHLAFSREQPRSSVEPLPGMN
jgi:G3E family GTPase